MVPSGMVCIWKGILGSQVGSGDMKGEKEASIFYLHERSALEYIPFRQLEQRTSWGTVALLLNCPTRRHWGTTVALLYSSPMRRHWGTAVALLHSCPTRRH